MAFDLVSVTHQPCDLGKFKEHFLHQPNMDPVFKGLRHVAAGKIE